MQPTLKFQFKAHENIEEYIETTVVSDLLPIRGGWSGGSKDFSALTHILNCGLPYQFFRLPVMGISSRNPAVRSRGHSLVFRREYSEVVGNIREEVILDESITLLIFPNLILVRRHYKSYYFYCPLEVI